MKFRRLFVHEQARPAAVKIHFCRVLGISNIGAKCDFEIWGFKGFLSMDNKQVKPGFTNYQPHPKYSWALSNIEGKGKIGKT